MTRLRLLTVMVFAAASSSLMSGANAQQYPYYPPMSSPPPTSYSPPPTSYSPPPSSYSPSYSPAPMSPGQSSYPQPQFMSAPIYQPTTGGGVTIVDNAFQPGQVTINKGDSLTWSDAGRNPHTVTADDGSFDSANGTSATLSSGQTFAHVFATPGRFPYHCRIHGGAGGVGMSGVVVVRGAVSPSQTSPSQMAFTGLAVAPRIAAGLLSLVLGGLLVAMAKRTAT